MSSESRPLIDDDEKSKPNSPCMCLGMFLFSAGLVVSVYGFTNSSPDALRIVGPIIGIIGLIIICCCISCCCSTEKVNTDLQPNQIIVDGHVGTFSDPGITSPIFHITQSNPGLGELNQHCSNYTMPYPQNLFPTYSLNRQIFNVSQYAAPFYQVQPSAPPYQVQNYSLDLPPPYSP